MRGLFNEKETFLDTFTSHVSCDLCPIRLLHNQVGDIDDAKLCICDQINYLNTQLETEKKIINDMRIMHKSDKELLEFYRNQINEIEAKEEEMYARNTSDQEGL